MKMMRGFRAAAMGRAIRTAAALAAAGLLASCEVDVESEFGRGVDFGNNNPNLIAAMGDSITEGYGVSGGACYVSRLAGMTGKNVLNFGVGGAQSGAGAGQVGGVLSTYKPGILLIFYGANDIIHGNGTSYTIENLRAMIRAAKANKTIPIVATLTPAFGSHRFVNSTARVRSQYIRDLALQEHCLVADLWNAFGENSAYLTDDGLHPNAVGHELIALTFRDAMQ